MNQDQNKNQDNPQGSATGVKFRFGWWAVLLVFMFLCLIAFGLLFLLPQGTPEITLPYSSFIDQVEKNNVASVTIIGSIVSGRFVNAIPAPVVTRSPGTTTTESVPGTTMTYTEFTTTFPSVSGDANLIPLLQAHGVQINPTLHTSRFKTVLLDTIFPNGLLMFGIIFAIFILVLLVLLFLALVKYLRKSS
jgi:ATP-dependent Zn protease